MIMGKYHGRQPATRFRPGRSAQPVAPPVSTAPALTQPPLTTGQRKITSCATASIARMSFVIMSPGHRGLGVGTEAPGAGPAGARATEGRCGKPMSAGPRDAAEPAWAAGLSPPPPRVD